MVVTTWFVMPTNEIKGMMHIKRDPGSNPACGKNFFCLNIKKFWYTCEKDKDKYNDVNKHLFDKMY
jgi:hypothetical protein